MHNRGYQVGFFLLLLVFGLSYSHAILHAEKGELITATVGQAGGHVLTSREVKISSVIDKGLLVAGAKANKISRTEWIPKDGSDAFLAHLNQAMLELVVNIEAENFNVADVSPAETKTRVQQIEDLVKDWPEWKLLDVSQAELEIGVLRKLRAKSFLKFKTESSGVLIGDEEAKQYYERNRVKFGNLPFAQFKPGIKDYLAKAQLEDKLKDWFELLKRKYKVRYLGIQK